jgi:hypothetical protein
MMTGWAVGWLGWLGWLRGVGGAGGVMGILAAVGVLKYGITPDAPTPSYQLRVPPTAHKIPVRFSLAIFSGVSPLYPSEEDKLLLQIREENICR